VTEGGGFGTGKTPDPRTAIERDRAHAATWTTPPLQPEEHAMPAASKTTHHIPASPKVFSESEVTRMVNALKAEGALRSDLVSDHVEMISRALGTGDIDDAYATFTDWIRQEARYAKAQRATNMNELVQTMLTMIDWMYDRIPRAAVKSAAQMAAH
jgi:hypothetical protein